MTTQKYSLKEALLLENTQPVHSFQETLASLVDSSSFDGYADELILDHGECYTILQIALDELSGEHVWVNSLYTTDKQGKPSEGCYRKGYAKEMMLKLTQAADQHGVILELIAAPPPRLKRQLPSLPDKDELARFYAQHGFVETDRNMAQVFMRRDPSQE